VIVKGFIGAVFVLAICQQGFAITCVQAIQIVGQGIPSEKSEPFTEWVNALADHVKSQLGGSGQSSDSYRAWVAAGNYAQYFKGPAKPPLLPTLGMLQNAVANPAEADRNAVLFEKDSIRSLLSGIQTGIDQIHSTETTHRWLAAPTVMTWPGLIGVVAAETYHALRVHPELQSWKTEVELRLSESAGRDTPLLEAPKETLVSGKQKGFLQRALSRFLLAKSGASSPEAELLAPVPFRIPMEATLSFRSLLVRDGQNRTALVLVEGALPNQPVLIVHHGPERP
jgi:hypothetical protein